VSWEHESSGAVGFNVYRMDAFEPVPPGELRARAALEGADSVADLLAARAGEGGRGGLVRLNDGIIEGHEYLDRDVVDGGRYAYVVGAVSADGEEVLAGPVQVSVERVVAALQLGASPNPLRVGSRLEFAAPAGVSVSLRIYDASGRLVRDLFSGTSSGGGRVVWDGRSDAGVPVASGVYFVRLTAGGEVATRKVAFVK
jgi:hypothetical protein